MAPINSSNLLHLISVLPRLTWKFSIWKKKKNGASDPNLLTFELSYRSSRTVFEVIGTKFWSYNTDMVREEKIIKLRFFKMCYIT